MNNVIHKRIPKWNDDKIIEELKKIIGDIGHLPTQKELRLMKRHDLCNAISKHGGLNKFRKLLGYKLQRISRWTDERIFKEIVTITDKIGHFPTCSELEKMCRIDLLSAISRYGGLSKFRKIMGYKPYVKSVLSSLRWIG